jgi:hypothetical protein
MNSSCITDYDWLQLSRRKDKRRRSEFLAAVGYVLTGPESKIAAALTQYNRPPERGKLCEEAVSYSQSSS